MAETESIGSVSVLIGGDYSPLINAFGQAQAAAAKAGQSVASAFTGGAAAAPGIVDQFGRAVGSAAAPTKTLADVCAQLASIQAVLEGNVNRSTTALTRQAAAAHGAVTEIQATSGALRVLEGSGGIRAAERFLTLIPGLGAALQTAFPVIGAIALASAIFHISDGLSEVAEKWTLVGISEKFAKDAADDYAKSVDKIKEKLASIDQANFTKAVGRVGGAANDATALQQQAIAVQNQANALKGFRDQQQAVLEGANAAIKRINDSGRGESYPGQLTSLSREAAAAHNELDGLNKSIGEFENQAVALRAESSQKAVTSLTGSKDESDTAKESSASLRTARLRASDERAKRDAESARQIVQIRAAEATQLAAIQTDAITGTEARALASAYAQVRIEQQKQQSLLQIAASERDTRIPLAQGIGAQESVGKDANARGAISARVTDQVAGLRDAYSSVLNEANAATAKARSQVSADIATWTRQLIDETTRGLEELQQKLKTRADEIKAAETKATEIRDKSAGDTGALALEGAKLQLEQQYGLAVIHTGQQQIQQLEKIAGLEDQARRLKIEAATEQYLDVPDDGSPKSIEDRAKYSAEVAKLTAESDNASVAAETRRLQIIQQQTLQFQLQRSLATAASAVPGAIGGGIAAGVFQHGKNTGIGDEIAKSLRGIGQQLFGQVLGQLITKMAIQAAVQTGLITVTSANTAATATNASVTGVHAGVMLTHAGIMIAHIAATIGQTIATAAQTIATNLNTLWLAIKSIFGFADGGSPPVGVPSIVGERGPEIFVPKGAGTIIPNHMVKGYANGAGLSLLPSAAGHSSVAHTAAFSGDMHIHIPAQASPRRHAEQIFSELPKVAKSKSSSFSPYSK